LGSVLDIEEWEVIDCLMSHQSRVSLCARAGNARCNCTWDAIGPLKPGERRSDGHPGIGPPSQHSAEPSPRWNFTSLLEIHCPDLFV